MTDGHVFVMAKTPEVSKAYAREYELTAHIVNGKKKTYLFQTFRNNLKSPSAPGTLPII